MESITTLLQQAQRLLAASNKIEATPILERLSAMSGCPVGVVLQVADIEIESKQAKRAQERLQTWIQAYGSSDEIDFMLAKAELGLGLHNNAKQRLLLLHQRLPANTPSASLALLLAMIETQQGDFSAAAQWYREAVRIQPSEANHSYRLAQMLYQHEDFDLAKAAVQEAIRLAPNKADYWILLGEIHARLNDVNAAIDCLQRTVAISPSLTAAWGKLAHLQIEMWHFTESDTTLSRALQHVDNNITFDIMRGHVKQELGETAAAIEIFQHAIVTYAPNLAALIAERLMLPQIYHSADDITQWRERYQRGLQSLMTQESSLSEIADQVFSLERSNFLLAYQGENDCALQHQYASFLGRLAMQSAPNLCEPRPIKYDGSRRLRVGFLGSLFRNCTAGLYFEKWITALDQTAFESVVYHTGPISDELTQRIAASCAEFVPLRLGAKQVAERVITDDLDILIYPEVGMDSITCILSALRLAPVQCAGWGHPVTTGSDAIDYFITCDNMEPDSAHTHYTEQLLKLPGIGVNYAMPTIDAGFTRAQLGFADSAHLYFCPQSLFKILPDMDELFADIIERDEHAVIVLFQGASLAITTALGTRIQETLNLRGIAPRKQLKFLPRMATAQFRQALTLADVVLDTTHWSGGNTSLDAFACGVPVVTWPGKLMRGRQTAAMLSMMELDELVVHSSDEYVQTAVDVASNKVRNQSLRTILSEKRLLLFNQSEPIHVFAESLTKMAIRNL
jgi:CRISPR-associated protein Csy1